MVKRRSWFLGLYHFMRYPSHERPLAFVPVPAAPHHGDYPLRPHCTHIVQKVRQSIRGVRIVYNHSKVLSIVDEFVSPGDKLRAFDSTSDDIGWYAHRHAGRHRAEDVGDVGLAEKRRRDVHGLPSPSHPHRDVCAEERQFYPRTNHVRVCGGIRAEAEHLRPLRSGRIGERRGVRVVGVHDGIALAGEHLEELELRREVRLHVAVVVQVVPREVREDARVEANRVAPVHRECVAAGFHHDRLGALIPHRSQQPLHLQGVRRRVVEAVLAQVRHDVGRDGMLELLGGIFLRGFPDVPGAVEPVLGNGVLNGAKHPRDLAGFLEDAAHEPARRRLAVRTGHGHNVHLRRRAVVKHIRNTRKALERVVDHGHWNIDVGRNGPARNDGDGAPFGGHRGEVVAVVIEAF
mmetsp:Transcript_7434/g.19085  ORF Transcript_7434/g.19085 Transcript_7434/m.19085 type:complete len:405 (-) Transcript_7434:454-1668(-)